MQHLFAPALLATVLALASAYSIASDEITEESVEPFPGSTRFNRLCEELMSRVLQQGNVTFAVSSAELGTNAFGMLDEIVEIAFDCPSLSITVTGNSDNTGNETANHALSKARAESVVTYMTERGIDPARLRACGAGRRISQRVGFELTFRGTKGKCTRYPLFL